MAAVSLAIVGKNNQPLYLREFVPEVGAFPDESVLFGLSQSLPPLPPPTTFRNGIFQCSLKQEFLLHAALDRFEELSGPPPGYGWRNRPGADGMFMGLLGVVDELRIYGYCTTTKIKFFLIVEDEALSKQQQKNADEDIKNLLKSLHQLYVEDLLNPFKSLDDLTILSERFEAQLLNYIAAFNQSEGMI
ncbi:Sedlin [Nitzschia inconspicua]|uniref:Sedlin n=1 Tax=Nitzschia inconspicua TaxID=303405 RepID=A0A9K3KK16_9STRA|nr:Sedlin [Nitzschia inconspicua]